MRITEAAQRLGTSPRMLRYRELLGLLPPVREPAVTGARPRDPHFQTRSRPGTATQARPGDPASRSAPGTPATPGKPAAPATLGNAATPGSSATPAIPRNPENPATPAAPGSPATPAAPGSPATPAAPGSPATPAAPGSPATSAAPGSLTSRAWAREDDHSAANLSMSSAGTRAANLSMSSGGTRPAGIRPVRGHRRFSDDDLAAVALALRIEQRYDVSPAALAFGLRVLTEPRVRAEVAELGRRIGKIGPPPARALEFEKERALRLLSLARNTHPDR